MSYYAHYGHNEFILCLGHGADKIKQYFLNYNECVHNDFVLTDGGREIELLSTDIDDWRITFVDTGLNSNIGERLRRVRQHIGDDAAVPRQLRRRAVRPAARHATSRTFVARDVVGALPLRARAAHVPHRPHRRATST